MNNKEEIISDRLKIYHPEKFPQNNSFGEDVMIGLTSENKFLLPKYFYDQRGSELFEEICSTEEYYPTRTEISILKNLSDDISERNSEKNLIVELGSGSSFKTDYILSSFSRKRDFLHYVPIDVSDILVESSRTLIEKYKNLFVTGIISFYEEGLEFIVSRDNSPKLIIFLGSSIGNFTEEEAVAFMKMLKDNMNDHDRLLVGFDMLKDRKILIDAYNDKCGVTSAFNLNILERINNELDGNFDAGKFEHKAVFNEEKSRIEMHIIAMEDMNVEIKKLNMKISFKKDERIHTENSYKFTYDMIKKLARDSGMYFSDSYTDDNNYFSLCAFRPL
ncbi:MAG: L-histidine N(alpha)-methyltransferase [Ignavibacteria bacterium]